MQVVRHEVIMKIKPGFINRATEVNDILEAVRRLAHEIPDVIRVSIGRSGDGINAMLVIIVPDEDALERYNMHPSHEKMVRLSNEISEDFVVMDYIVSI